MRLWTTSLFAPQALPEKAAKQLLSQEPVVAVDAVLHLGSFDLALYQPGILQFLQVLRHGSLGYGEFLVDVTEIASLLLGEELQNSYPCGMAHGLGKPRQLFLPDAVILV